MSKKKDSIRDERRSARSVGGRLTPSSGAWFGEDYALGSWSVQRRKTSAMTLRIDAREVRQKLRRAIAEGRRLAYDVDIGGQRLLIVPFTEVTVTEDGFSL